MKRLIFGLIIILAGTAILAGILYYVFVDNNFPFSYFNRPESTVRQEAGDQPAGGSTSVPEEGSGQGGPKMIEAGDIIIPEEGGGADSVQDPLEETRLYVSSEKDTLLRMSGSFAERFGSYSNHSNFSNIDTLKAFMTKKMQNWADQYVSEAKKFPRDDENYYGITTRAVSEEFLEYDDDLGVARVLVITRRKEAVGSTQNQGDSYTQDIEIEMKKENGLWKVNGAYWGD